MMTVKQIADKAGVSKTTVTKYLKAYEAEHKSEATEQITKNEQNIIQITDELSEKLLEAILNQKENRQPTANIHKTPQTVGTNPLEESQATCTNLSQTTANCTANGCESVQAVSTNPPQTANHDAIAALNRVIETQQAQIDQLNKTLDQFQQDKIDLKEQLAVKDEQIKQLNILLSQQQQLHQTLQVKLLETEAEADEETEQPKKRGLFGIFKKK